MKSMTGYGSATVASDGREFTVELKSVNHRFLDLNIRMPRMLMYAEDALRKTIGTYISRGHVEVSVQYTNTREDSRTITVDENLIRQYTDAFESIAAMGFQNNICVSDIIRIPDVLTVTQGQDDAEAVQALLLQTTAQACEQLNLTRKKEGEKIGADLLAKLDTIHALADKIDQTSQGNLEDYAARLQKRLDELLGDAKLDPQRLHQEVAIYADKIAIDEELVRLDTHIKNMRAYMQEEEEIGRKLDFFIQELNREVNTIGSKSVNADIAKLVVTAKGEIEKLREQIQNIE